jgi:hypothetical protein
MLAEPPLQVCEIRALVRQSELAARRLIARAAHLEKLARRARTGSDQRLDLNARALEMRAAAELLLTEVSELSRKARTEQRAA